MSAMPERYEPDESAEGGPCMALDEYGQWVALCDYSTLESRLLAAEARVRELQAPVMCSVCVGRPLPSGKPCICGDTVRTEAAEMHGLRVRCFELEDENEKLEARVREVEAAAKAAEARWNSPDAVLVTTQVLNDLTTLRAERDALVARIEKAAADLRAVGGYDNELLAVPAGGVRSILTDLRAILAREET